MGATDRERTDAAAPRGWFETACWFVAVGISAVAMFRGVLPGKVFGDWSLALERTDASRLGLVAAAFCAANLVVLARRALRPGFSWIAWSWSLVLAFLSPLALWSAILLGRMVFAAPEHPWSPTWAWHFPLVTVGFVATFVALRGWEAFRPAWWHGALFLAPFLGLNLLLASPTALQWFEERLYGPVPEDFSGAADWAMRAGDPTEWIYPWTNLTWAAFFLSCMIRGVIVTWTGVRPNVRADGPVEASGAWSR